MASDSLSPPPPPLPPSASRPPEARAAAGPPVVQVVDRSGGFGRQVTAFVTALTALMVVFGLGIGAGLLLLGSLGLWIGAGADRHVEWETYREGGSKSIAVLPVRGPINDRLASFVRLGVDEILATPSIKAVVLRVDSPGGGVTASDQIWHEIERLRAAKLPLVASYGSVAASGGYYVSCGADHIVAQPTCITGSIGVIAQVMTLEGLMDKVGITPVTLVASASPRKSVANDIFRTWDETDRAQIRRLLDDAYASFFARVKSGRSAAVSDPAALEAVADGSVFTAREAVDRGLVDAVGYLTDAIAHAEKAATLPAGRATVMLLRERPPLFGDLPLVEGGRGLGAAGLDADRLRGLVNDLASVRLQYLSPLR